MLFLLLSCVFSANAILHANNISDMAEEKICPHVMKGNAFPGNDINDGSQTKVNTAEDCRKLCVKNNGCKGWEWGHDKINCWLKTTLTNRQPRGDGYFAGSKTSCPICLPVVTGFAFPGNDINDGRKTKVDTAAKCQELCVDEPKCKAYEWGHEGTNCWLKKKLANRQAVNDGYVAGTVEGCAKRCDPTITGYAFVGNDINNGRQTKVDTADECRQLCVENNTCEAWEWGHEGTNCWLKTKLANRVRRTPRYVAGTKKACAEVSEHNVIKLLNELIAEGWSEIRDINARVFSAQKKNDAAQIKYNGAVKVEGSAREAKEDALTAWNTAKGVFQAAKAELDEAQDGLEREIALLKNVTLLLKGLLSGQGFVEQNKVDISSFISLADQANPDKVREVIGLVDGLLAVAEGDLEKLQKAVNDAHRAAKATHQSYLRAVGIWDAAVDKMKKAEAELSTATGVLEAAKKHAGLRIPVVEDEIKDLKEVIELIKSLL